MRVTLITKAMCLLVAALAALSCESADQPVAEPSSAGAGASAVQVSQAALTIAESAPLVHLTPDPQSLSTTGATWTDVNGGPLAFTAGSGAAAPTVIASGVGSYPGLRFSGAQYMSGALGDTASWSGLTVVAVIKTQSSLSYRGHVLGAIAPGVSWGLTLSHFSGPSPYIRIEPSTTAVVSWKRSKSNIQWIMRRNGITTSISANDSTFPTGALQAHLGALSVANGVPAYSGKFDLHELLVYKRELTEDEVHDVEGELGAKYGIPIDTDSIVPSQLPWDQVSAGWAHGCGIRAGRLYCWGSNAQGALGIGTRELGERIRQVGQAADWTLVAAGWDHTCAIRKGQLYCWGNNDYGELGAPPGMLHPMSPTRVGSASDWSAVSTDFTHTCGIRAGGQLWCWGENTGSPNM